MITKSIRYAEKFCKQNDVKNIIDDLAKILENGIKEIGYQSVPGHSLEHILRVLSLSLAISCFEGGDRIAIALAAILHDIARFKEEEDKSIDHAKLSAMIARKVLSNSKFSNLAEKVAKIIEEHRFRNKEKPSSIESAILQDADRLDALGFIGVARVFAYGGYRGRSVYESFKHFHEKILNLPNLMNTKTGKIIAEKRVKKIILFLEETRKEIILEDLKDILAL